VSSTFSQIFAKKFFTALAYNVRFFAGGVKAAESATLPGVPRRIAAALPRSLSVLAGPAAGAIRAAAALPHDLACSPA